ncbi:M23 family metallopeptidase [Brevibacillus sp. HB1.3]|uniref:M23 family metallopeptidase n=1 Tax=Bacillales TaxID=1385 RepID=UPI000349C098|nr:MULTISPECIES: M23 family metallopeptidase [Bacillales]KMZ43777.1 hypothetical protein AC624_23330 [Bacillus sp. FJAT-27238]NQF13498.1 M23 family metallopeptidase [Brevibacillus sp. HB1.3]
MKNIYSGLLGVALVLSGTGIASAMNSVQPSPAELVKPMGDPDNPYAEMRWVWPTDGTRISGEFGEYRSPKEKNHKGIDIAVYKKPVYAVSKGVVLSSGIYSTKPKDSPDYIKYVTIKQRDRSINGNKLITRYLHLKSYSVKRGDDVYKGDQIGISGNSGAGSYKEPESNYHLHFDVNEADTETPTDYDQMINPLVFFPDVDTRSSARLIEEDGHQNLDHPEENLDNPEYFIDQKLIDYVDEKTFYEWLNSVEEGEGSLTNYKKKFNLTDKDLVRILDEGLKKNFDEENKDID